MGICHVCREADTTTQIKAGCGCLIYICDDCRDYQGKVAHEKCIVCKGGKTPDQIEEEERNDYERSQERSFYDIDDSCDPFADDFDCDLHGGEDDDPYEYDPLDYLDEF